MHKLHYLYLGGKLTEIKLNKNDLAFIKNEISLIAMKYKNLGHLNTSPIAIIWEWRDKRMNHHRSTQCPSITRNIQLVINDAKNWAIKDLKNIARTGLPITPSMAIDEIIFNLECACYY